MLRSLIFALSACALIALFSAPAGCQSLAGLKPGDLPSAVDRSRWKLIASDGAETFRQEKYRDPYGTTLAVAYDRQTRKALFIEMDWAGDPKGKDAAGVPSLIFGVTTLDDIRRTMGSNGFAYESNGGMIREEGRLVAFNAYELKDRPETVAVFITVLEIGSLGGRIPKTEEVAKGFKLQSIILADMNYLDALWGEAKIYDPNNKPAMWPTR